MDNQPSQPTNYSQETFEFYRKRIGLNENDSSMDVEIKEYLSKGGELPNPKRNLREVLPNSSNRPLHS